MARLRDYRLPKLQRPTPLHDAACFGNVAKALEALKDDPNIDVNDASLGANTPLQGLNSIPFRILNLLDDPHEKALKIYIKKFMKC